jgi:hypothetical protein
MGGGLVRSSLAGLLIFAHSCGAKHGAGADPGDGGAEAGPRYPLDMNDVTILTPLPRSNTTPVLLRGIDLADDGTAMVPAALFDRLAVPADASPIVGRSRGLEALHVVAVRFDLCDRRLPGKCPETEDARMRLVFQPIVEGGSALDIGFHAFYAIWRDEIPGAVSALRDLAMTDRQPKGQLRVSSALIASNPEPYATKLRAFVKRYGGETRLVRLTMNAQPEGIPATLWLFSGVEKRGNDFVDIAIVGSTAISERVFGSGETGFTATPVADTPPGLQAALSQSTSEAADTTQRRDYLGVLAAVENPMRNTAETAACVACHVSTVVTNVAATKWGIDALTLPERYTSTFDLSIAYDETAETHVTRALGYRYTQPMISQRVVNETAQALTEIEQRYPPR